MREPLALIVAVSRNGVIGKGGKLAWHLPEDLKRFRAITLGHAIVMGRKTWDSIGRPLPGRRSIVVSRSAKQVDGAEVAGSLEEALALARQTDPEPVIIGGGELYAQALPKVTRLHLTRVDQVVDGDAFFPQLDLAQWRELSREEGPPGVQFLEYERA